MGKPLKYKIGSQINDWKIIGFSEGESVKYTIQCKCGYVKQSSSKKLFLLTSCRVCQGKSKSDVHVGKTYGNFTVLDNPIYKGIRCLLVKCKQCENTFHSSFFIIKNQKSCRRCRFGFHPGKVIDGITILEKLDKGKYKMKCFCGNIFEKNPRKYLGKLTGCGCMVHLKYLNEVQNKIGKKFENLKINKILGNTNGHYVLEMLCKCGKKFKVNNGHEFKGKSCGCNNIKYLPKGENAPRSRFKNYEIIAMRELYTSGSYSINDLSDMYRCSNNYVYRIIKKMIWKHV